MDNNNVSDFWQRLNIALASCNKTSLKEVCMTAGVAYQTLLNQKCQNRFPSVPVIAALAKELDCTIDWLLTGKEYKERMQNYYSAKIQSAIDILQQLN